VLNAPQRRQRALYRLEHRWQGLARCRGGAGQGAQAELDIIPKAAAEAIAKAARYELLDRARLEEETSPAPGTRSCRWSGS
jgi:hypothetical protein